MSRPQTCSRCGQEVRYGKRGGTTGYLHREDVDHMPAFGKLWTPEEGERLEAELDRVRVRPVGEVEDDVQKIEFYTTRRVGLKGPAAKAYDALHTDAFVMPKPEVACHPVEPDSFPPRSGIRQIINLVDKTDGWERRRLTHARGPYVGSSGEVLSISDSVVLGARGPGVDSGVRVAVASWRDGAFDFAYTGILKDGAVTTTAANSNALKAWIKDTP